MASKALGTVNGFVKSTGWIGNRSFEFDGTTKGLVRSAVYAGAVDGTAIKANFGGKSKSGARDMTIVLAAHDDRAMGYWAI